MFSSICDVERESFRRLVECSAVVVCGRLRTKIPKFDPRKRGIDVRECPSIRRFSKWNSSSDDAADTGCCLLWATKETSTKPRKSKKLFNTLSNFIEITTDAYKLHEGNHFNDR